jgi:hypothetical protein
MGGTAEKDQKSGKLNEERLGMQAGADHAVF